MLILGSLPALSKAQVANERICMEGIELLGSVTFGVEGSLGESITGIFDFPYENSYRPNPSGVPLIGGLFSGGSVYHDGKIYCNRYDDSGNIQSVKPVWQIYDAETYQLLYERELSDNCVNTTKSLAYDPTTDKIYGFVVDYFDTHLVSIDPETGEMTKVGETLDRYTDYGSIACNKDGQLFAVAVANDYSTGTSDLQLVKIRKSDARVVKVGTISCDNLMGQDQLVFMNYDQALFFNNATDELYWFMGSSSYELDDLYTPLFRLNTLSGKATLVSYIDKIHHISGAYFKEPDFAVPSVIDGFEFIPSGDGSNSGTLRITMPEVSYSGESLSGQTLTLTATEDGNQLLNVTAQPGEQYVSDVMQFTDGFHTLSVTVSNDAGNSPTVQREFYVGYDVPLPPQNVTLTNDGLTTTLTWEPPTQGVNGLPINSDNFTYTVVRYPYEVTVATDLKECSFTETHPEEMTRYIYTVTASDGVRTSEISYSNALILGEPLRPPYGGIFKDVADMYNYYTLIDANSDGFSWTYDSNTASAVYIYSPFQDADDWMISPPIIFDAMTTYELTFKAYSSLDGYLEALEVKFGKDRTPEALSEMLLDIPEVPTVNEDNPVQEFSTEFTTDEEGLYYYGFHAVSPAYHEYLYVFDIQVKAKGTEGIETSGQDAQDVIVVAGKGHLHIGNPDNRSLEVYNTQGVLVHKTTDDNVDLSLDKGVYLVKSDDKVQKALVY